jgi:hypothetical protein
VNGATSQCIPQSYEEDGHQYKCELPAQMAGVLITAGVEVDAPPKDSKDLNSGRYNFYYYGVSSYARLVRILEKRSGAGQFGLFGMAFLIVSHLLCIVSSPSVHALRKTNL